MSPLRPRLSSPGWRVRDDCTCQGNAPQTTCSRFARLVVYASRPVGPVDHDSTCTFQFRAVDGFSPFPDVKAHTDCATKSFPGVHTAGSAHTNNWRA